MKGVCEECGRFRRHLKWCSFWKPKTKNKLGDTAVIDNKNEQRLSIQDQQEEENKSE